MFEIIWWCLDKSQKLSKSVIILLTFFIKFQKLFQKIIIKWRFWDFIV